MYIYSLSLKCTHTHTTCPQFLQQLDQPLQYIRRCLTPAVEVIVTLLQPSEAVVKTYSH